MGKRQIGEMQPFELIVTLIIADLACIPMADVSIPLIYGIVSILALFLLHQIFTLIEKSGDLAKKVLSGKPSIVINSNGVDLVELRSNNLGVDDLIESMRALGYFHLDQVDYAIFESNGKLSALENKNPAECSSLPLLVVNEGKIIKRNLKFLQAEEKDVLTFISQKCSLKNTEVLTVDGTGKAYFKQKRKKYELLTFPLKEGVRW
jgi:uncharacterized membrane protein YcaP (DUF421 family)